MKPVRLLQFLLLLFLGAGCAPFDEIYSHDFSSGYFKLKRSGEAPVQVYLYKDEDSLTVYPVTGSGKSRVADKSVPKNILIENITPGSYFHNSTFIKTSLDIDLSSAVIKFRPAAANVPPQISANVNGLFYGGFRKDYFRILSSRSKINKVETYVRQTGFDFGLFAGIGITPVNPTVTEFHTIQEYDGIVFQKGIAVFGTYEHLSVGVAIGFDNLLDRNKTIWIYNNRPWLGLVLGIANF